MPHGDGMKHDPICPNGEMTWLPETSLCIYCLMIARVREDERQKIDLKNERETNDLLRKILTRREEILGEFWQREREENLRRITELETKQSKLWRKCHNSWKGRKHGQVQRPNHLGR
jgi:hypothetical protein